MTIVVVSSVTALFFGSGGVALGAWWARSRQPPLRVFLKEAPPTAATDSVAAEQPARDAEQPLSMENLVSAEEILTQLYNTTQGLAANVDHHNNQVNEINEELIHLEAPSPVVLKTIEQLVFANREMQSQLVQAEKQLQSQATQLQSLSNDALTDALTGTANRRAFDMALARQHVEYQTSGEPLSLIIMDIDKFKPFNDEYGHQVGDEILQSVAKVLQSKTDADDVLARYGGEEFAAVLPGTTLATARNVAERLRTSTENSRWTIDNKSLGVTLSVGVAQLLPGESIEDLIRRADEAMYASKAAGRNCGHGHNGQSCFPLSSAIDVKKEQGERLGESKTRKSEKAPVAKKTVAKKTSSKPQPAQSKASTLQDDAKRCREALRLAVGGQPEQGENQPQGVASEVERSLPERRKTAPASAEAASSPHSFDEDLRRQLSSQTGGGVSVSALLVQVDEFEQIVAAHGESIGKKVISAVLNLLYDAAQEFDHSTQLHDGAIALSAPGASFADLSKIAREVHQGCSRCVISVDGGLCLFTVSIGVAEGADGENAEKFIRRARSAMSAAQECGGNRCFFHSGAATRPLPVSS